MLAANVPVRAAVSVSDPAEHPSLAHAGALDLRVAIFGGDF